jgi:GNAT superfamily N-acetyltransferase
VTPTVRRLGAGEADLLRTVRLRALGDAPMAFGSTLAREEGYEPEKWERWAAESASGERQAIFIAEPEAGMASGVIDDEDPALAHLYAMWVAPDARGTGAGKALVDAVVAWATDRGRAAHHLGRRRQCGGHGALRRGRLRRHRPARAARALEAVVAVLELALGDR